LNTDPVRRAAGSGRTPAALAPPPRRAVVTIAATVLGLVLLFTFKTPDAPSAPGRPLATASGTGASSSTGRTQVDGDVIQTQFGDIQVRLIESGGKIVDIQALQLPFDRRRSLEISHFAEPILHSEALQAQSAQIDTVSGATYTSDAYRTSLQSAIDHAHG
jgi:uncharacterized protein with FMN-binding domain